LTEAALGFAELHGGGSRVVLLPALGGRIRDLTIAGREWLWHNPEIPFALPEPTERSYVLAADSGGMDECAPTIAPCTVDGVALTDHGDCWGQRPAFRIETHADGQRATCEWILGSIGFRLRRVVSVGATGAVRFDYTMANESSRAHAVQWSAHPLFPLTPATRLSLPEGAELRIDDYHGLAAGAEMTGGVWPYANVGGVPRDLSRPIVSLEPGQACMAFVRMPRGEITLALDEADARLLISIDGGQLPWTGLWLNRGGWSPFPARRSLWSKLTTRRRTPYVNLAIEPCLAGAGSLAAAQADGTAPTFAAGETRHWSMTFSGSSL
jgi:hypothetical protein